MGKRRIVPLAAAFLAAGSFVAHHFAPRTLCSGFLPENSMRIPVGDVNAAGISEDMFNKVLDRAEAVYKPIVAGKGGTLVVKRLWTNATVNASAQRMGGSWIINMYGGLARHASITEAGFALVACHEIGHHIGGFPKYRGWATNEGGADYFATLKCLRHVLGASAEPGVDPVAGEACAGSFGDEASRNLCQNGTLGGSSVAGLFQALRQEPKPPAFGSPDPAQVDQTYDAHPGTQCRMDTYFQGAICNSSVGDDVSNDSPVPGACTRKGGQKTGFRPRCWYKPPADEPAGAPAVAGRPELRNIEALKGRIEALSAALMGRGV